MPIKYLLILFIIWSKAAAFPFLGNFTEHTQYTIMIDPAGDAGSTGRQLDDAFERGLTLQCAERLKSMLEERKSNVRVIITRQPGETVAPLQNANFANRLDVHLFMTIHFYQETETKPKVYLYHFSYGDEAVTKLRNLAFYSYDQAYLFNASTTQHMMSSLHQSMSLYKKQFDCKGPYKLPLKSLIGIKTPALVIEAGLKHKDDWVQLVEPLIAGMESLIKS